MLHINKWEKFLWITDTAPELNFLHDTQSSIKVSERRYVSRKVGQILNFC
jgi:hypothetical protein